MNKPTVGILLGLALLVVTGCGKNPSSTPSDYSYERVVHARPLHTAVKASAVKPVAAARQSVAVPFSKAVNTQNSLGTPAAQSPLVSHTVGAATGNDLPGSLALAVKVSGTAVVATLALDLLDAAGLDALQPVLPVANGLATWQQDSAKPGTYSLKLKALGPDGIVLGQATTQAIVKAGEPTEVTIDLRVNAAAAPVPPASQPVQSSGVTQTSSPATPISSSTSSTSGDTVSTQSTSGPASTPAQGGTLGLNLDIQ